MPHVFGYVRARAAMAAIMFTLIIGIASPSIAALEIGKSAPSFTATDTNGATASNDSIKGKFTVLEWTNHSCPFVKKFYDVGKMQELQKTYRDKGVVWISVISSAVGNQGYVAPAEANAIAAENKSMPNHIILDTTGDIGRAYGAKTTPTMIIIDPQGRVVYSGAIDSINSKNSADISKADNYVVAALDEAMAGKPVTTPATRSYGCSVKY